MVFNQGRQPISMGCEPLRVYNIGSIWMRRCSVQFTHVKSGELEIQDNSLHKTGFHEIVHYTVRFAFIFLWNDYKFKSHKKVSSVQQYFVAILAPRRFRTQALEQWFLTGGVNQFPWGASPYALYNIERKRSVRCYCPKIKSATLRSIHILFT